MQNDRSTARLEIAVYGVLILVALAVFVGTLGLPVSNREPLGSSSVPQAVSVIVALLCLTLMARAIRVLNAPHPDAPPAPDGEGVYRRRFDLALSLFGLALVFAFLLEQRLLRADILTSAFLALGFLILNRFRPRAWIPSLVLAVVLGVATTYVFKNFFYIDLP